MCSVMTGGFRASPGLITWGGGCLCANARWDPAVLAHFHSRKTVVNNLFKKPNYCKSIMDDKEISFYETTVTSIL